MQPSLWTYTGQSVIGTSHQKLGLPCQDACQIAMRDQRLVAVVADGAGSVKHSDVGARHITEHALMLVQGWSPFVETEDAWTEHLRELIHTLRQHLKTTAEDQGWALKELAATCLVMIVSDRWIAGAQIGDGAMIYGTANEEDVQLLLSPPRSEYLNETTFLTSDEYADALCVVTLEQQVNRVALLSDGLQMLALDMKTNPPMPHQSFFRPFFASLDQVKNDAERAQHLNAFLHSKRVCRRTDDDKTLVFARRER